jgi:hypothetical protein
VEALLWVAAAVFAIWYTNFFKQVFTNKNINQIFLNLFIMGMGVNVVIAIYVSFVLPLRGINDFETHNPKLVQVGAAAGFICFISLLIAIWKVWGLWSIAIVMVLLMGML